MKKLRKFHWIIVGCCATVAVAVSVFVYLHFSLNATDRDNETGAPNVDASNAKALEHSSQANLIYRTPQEALDELVKTESNFQRTASLYAYLKTVNERDLHDLLRRTENIERASVRSNIQTVVVRRVASVDPNQALDWITSVPKIRREPLLERLFHDWSLKNLTQAVEGAKTLNGIDRQTVLDSVLSARKDLSEATLLKVARELGLEEFALQQISRNQTLALLDEPSSAWDVLVNDDVEDEKQLDLFRDVATAWKDEDGFDVLLRASESFPNENDRSALSKIIEDVVGDNLGEAFKYVRSLSQETRGELPRALAMVAGRVDPELALEEIAAWSDDPIHVPLLRIVSTTWARSDPRSMINQLELVPQISLGSALRLAFTRLAYLSPEEAIGHLERASKFVNSQVSLPAVIARQWSHTDPVAALEWSISYAGSNGELRKTLLASVFTNLIASDIEKAIEISGEIRSKQSSLLDEASYDIVRKLAQMGRIEEAIERVPLLNNNAGHFAIKNIGWKLVRAGEPYAAIELGANIPTPDPSLIITGPVSYFNGIFDLWATRDPQQLFDSLPSLTSPLLRSMAARTLLDHQESRPTLPNESIKDAERILSEYPVTENLHLLELQLQDEKGLIDLDQMVLPPGWTEE
ncbi:MAG: hypothetical protein F4219_09270 [Gammaproteobacteria bacterium]|nr:hypothetical protein [Gammaproteobacteria bacterium]